MWGENISLPSNLNLGFGFDHSSTKNSTSCVLFSQFKILFHWRGQGCDDLVILSKHVQKHFCFVCICPCASLIMESNTTVARYSNVHEMFFRDWMSAIVSNIQTDRFWSTSLCSELFSMMLLKAALFVFTKQPSVVAIDQEIGPSSCRRISLIFSCLNWARTNNFENTCLSALKMVFLSVLETLVLTENVFRALFRIRSRKVILLPITI